MKCSLVILGAGPPHRGRPPAVLAEPFAGTSVLEWILDATGYSFEDLVFVAGYGAELIHKRFPKIRIEKNNNWSLTGSGASLLSLDFDTESALIVCYSDILFRSSAVFALRESDADIVVAWDSAWKHRYAERGSQELELCEKVCVSQSRVLRLGADLQCDFANGEFIGLVRFTPRALQLLDLHREELPQSLQKRHLSEYIEYLRIQGLSVAGVDLFGNWAELNEPRDIARFILGTKAETLSRLRGLVRYAVIQDQITCTVGEWNSDRVKVLIKVRQYFSGLTLAVRSSARNEDTFHSSNAGLYSSFLSVNTESELEEAIEGVISSYGKPETDDQVLIQPMVQNVAISGVAFTRTLEHSAPWYVVNFETTGDTEAITSGISGDHRTMFMRRGCSLESLPEPRLAPLITALKEIEELLFYDAIDVEFAIDVFGSVYLLQVRPIVINDKDSSTRHDEVFEKAIEVARNRFVCISPSPPHLPGDAQPLYGIMPDWNPAEIIGIAPTELSMSLYRYLVADDIWATQRAEYGYRDIRPAPLLVSFVGHPYVDVRASFASFIPKEITDDLAGRLLNFYLDWLRTHNELHDKIEFEVVLTCLAPNFERWVQRLRNSDFSDTDILALREGLRTITLGAFERYLDDLSKIEIMRLRFNEIKSDTRLTPLERARLLLDDCRRLGTLPFAHLARGAFVAVTLLREAVAAGVISANARDSFLASIRTVGHQLIVDARAASEAQLDTDIFIERYGHLRPGTYDITSPRYDSVPEQFLFPLIRNSQEVNSETQSLEPWTEEKENFFAALSALGLPGDSVRVEDFLRKVIEGREYAKFMFSRNLSEALEALAEVGKTYGLTRRQVSHLSLSDLLSLRASAIDDGDVALNLHKRATEEANMWDIATAFELPPLISKLNDFDAFIIGADRPNFIGSHSITAECIDLGDRRTASITELSGRIVLILQADPGYEWLFGQGIAGLITLYGGVNSHMAIRAAEFCLPAAIGVGAQRYRELANARVLEISPLHGVLRVIQ